MLSTEPPSSGAPGLVSRVPAAVLFAAFLVQTVASARILTATSDETTHLPSGYTYLETGDFRLNTQHPPLVKLLAALPLVCLKPRLDLEDSGWRSSPPDEWGFGRRFLYRNDADRLLFWGRMPMVLLGLLLGVYVWRWARDLFGEAAGILALGLFAFCPTIVAHAHLVTMDVGLAAFSFASFYHLWRYCGRSGAGHLLAAAVALGLALATKFSAVVYVPVAAGLLALAAPGQGGRLRRSALALAVLIAVPAFVVWSVQFFPSDPLFYWKGMLLVNKDHNPTYADYLMGGFKVGGWWYYLPVALVLKTPIPTLFLVGSAIALARRLPAPGRLDDLFLLAPAFAFLAASCAFAANLGVRYLIPILPPLFVFASRVAPLLVQNLPGRVFGLALGLWLVVGAARIYPDHLAYFNEAAGGPERGYEWLDDSNVDWGQDLRRLRAWMEEHGVSKVRLLYPWNGSPDYYGIRYEPVTAQDWLEAPRPGTYAISTMALVRGRLTAREEGARSDWLDRYRPVDRVGYSFYIYRFEGPPDAHVTGPGRRNP